MPQKNGYKETAKSKRITEYKAFYNHAGELIRSQDEILIFSHKNGRKTVIGVHDENKAYIDATFETLLEKYNEGVDGYAEKIINHLIK